MQWAVMKLHHNQLYVKANGASLNSLFPNFVDEIKVSNIYDSGFVSNLQSAMGS